jgi:hypothetical protein
MCGSATGHHAVFSPQSAAPVVQRLLCCAVLHAGDPKNRQMISCIGPQRMAAMLKQLGRRGAVHVSRHTITILHVLSLLCL